ncbi:hypothetical protein [Burkholderia stabilis]|uniref:hypothetical protein n=1 Tax=Burkholderia stabilis TaxID=95485 RepID=UPI0011476EB5|nr:hypothetical protein [Burkholderia stabilis]
MKAATLAVVVATAAASNSYAQPTSDAPATVPNSQNSVQPKYVSQLNAPWKIYQRYRGELDSLIARSISQEAGEEVAKIISRPKTSGDFARNLKIIFDRALLLQDVFYTERNLKDIFNLEEVSIFSDSDSDSRRISIMASVPGSVIPRRIISKASGWSVAGANFVGGMTIYQSGKANASINFGIYKGGPDFEATLKIFAKKFVRVLPQPSPHGGPGAATASYGNETLRYQQVDNQIEKTITIGFNPDAELSNVLIEFERN